MLNYKLSDILPEIVDRVNYTESSHKKRLFTKKHIKPIVTIFLRYLIRDIRRGNVKYELHKLPWSNIYPDHYIYYKNNVDKMNYYRQRFGDRRYLNKRTNVRIYHDGETYNIYKVRKTAKLFTKSIYSHLLNVLGTKEFKSLLYLYFKNSVEYGLKRLYTMTVRHFMEIVCEKALEGDIFVHKELKVYIGVKDKYHKDHMNFHTNGKVYGFILEYPNTPYVQHLRPATRIRKQLEENLKNGKKYLG